MKKPRNGKRSRRVRHPMDVFENEWIDVDPDAFWQNLLDLPESERISSLAEAHTWDVILDDLDNPPEFRAEFMKRFHEAEAGKVRAKAIMGLSPRNNSVSALIAAARAYERHQLSYFSDDDGSAAIAPLYVDADGREWDAEMIGSVFARWVCGTGLKNLANQIRNLASAENTKVKRKSESIGPTNPTRVWMAFCERIVSTKRIPLVADLSETIFDRWKYSIDPSDIRRIGKSLGISWTKPAENLQ